jgi:uncharacterized protein DUF5681
MGKRRGSSRSVGYKNPPRRTQFRPGQSGNPKGRPKGSKNLRRELEKELAARISIDDRGSQKAIPVRRLILKQLVRLAAKGDLKGIGMVLDRVDRADDDPPSGPAQEVASRPEDKLVMASIIRRIRSMDKPPDEGTEDAPEPSKPTKTSETKD